MVEHRFRKAGVESSYLSFGSSTTPAGGMPCGFFVARWGGGRTAAPSPLHRPGGFCYNLCLNERGRLNGGPEGPAREPRQVPAGGRAEERQGGRGRHPPRRRAAGGGAAGVRAAADRAERGVQVDRQGQGRLAARVAQGKGRRPQAAREGRGRPDEGRRGGPTPA